MVQWRSWCFSGGHGASVDVMVLQYEFARIAEGDRDFRRGDDILTEEPRKVKGQ